VPAGDDNTDWHGTRQTYDWKGRPLEQINQDDTYKDFSYAGCGCAGGEVVVARDEVGRRQKITYDILGRPRKTEVLFAEPKDQPLNGEGTVYATTVNTLNARDQLTMVRQWAGAENGGAYQETTMGYDGYGRLQTKHAPEQQADPYNPLSTDHTTYDYNPDDTINWVKDARGAKATYGYNYRRRVTSISYYAPSGVTPSSDVAFDYDAAGNRASMNDGFGNKTYSYNQLSQLLSETRTFSDPNNSAINGVSATLSYEYNLAGELKKITDATGMSINYGYDTVGRLNGVTGSGNLYAASRTMPRTFNIEHGVD
jgi:YD repeat-containing protein